MNDKMRAVTLIVDSAPDAIITIDDSRKIRWVNGAVSDVRLQSLRTARAERSISYWSRKTFFLPILAKT